MKVVMDAQEFKRIIDNTKKFTRIDSDLMNYICLDIDSDAGIIKATALDGHRISIEYAGLKDCDESFRCLVKSGIPKIGKHDELVEIELRENYCYVTVGDYTFRYKQPVGEFYDADKVISVLDKEPKAQVYVNPAFLKDALEAAKNTIGRFRTPTAKIEVRNPDEPVVVYSENKTGAPNNVKYILPVKHNE